MSIRLTRHIILFVSFLIGTVFSQKIVHMNGTYDLDGDNHLEFIALELDPTTDIFPTIVRYYEILAIKLPPMFISQLILGMDHFFLKFHHPLWI